MIGGASGLVDCGDGAAVEPDGIHREVGVIGQVGEVGGDECGGGRHNQGGAGLGPLLEGFPRRAVTGPGVLGNAVVQAYAETLDVGGVECGGGGREFL